MNEVSFWLPGKPQTAGSKTAVPMGAKLGVIEAGSQESRARKRSWRSDLRDAALKAAFAAALAEESMADVHPVLFDAGVPITLTLVIVRRRPSTHMRSGQFSGLVKPAAVGLLPVARPDATKILRAVEDALTGVLWADDSQIVEQRVWKTFADQVRLPVTAEGVAVKGSRADADSDCHSRMWMAGGSRVAWGS